MYSILVFFFLKGALSAFNYLFIQTMYKLLKNHYILDGHYWFVFIHSFIQTMYKLLKTIIISQ